MIKFGNRHASYFKYIDMEGEKIYYNLPNSHKTYLIDLASNKTTRILKDSSACHNFNPFKTRAGSFCAIGGMDDWKKNSIWRNIETFGEFKRIYKSFFGEGYRENEKRFEKFKFGIEYIKQLEHCDGLYLFHSQNGIEWKPVQKIIDTKHDGLISGKNWGKSTEFDTSISCVYDEVADKYFLYIRANIQKGSRFIQYTTSEDLIYWDRFKLIDLPYDVSENYYSPTIIRYKGLFIGMIPYYKGNYSCIRIIKSYDGHSWTIANDIYESKPIKVPDSEHHAVKNYMHFVQGIIEDQDEIKYYLHYNYFGNVPDDKVYIKQHRMAKEDFNGIFRLS